MNQQTENKRADAPIDTDKKTVRKRVAEGRVVHICPALKATRMIETAALDHRAREMRCG